MINNFAEEAIVKVSIPIYSVLILGEILLSNWRGDKFYSFKDVLNNIYLTVVNGGLDLLMRGLVVVGVMSWVYEYRFFEIQNPYWYWFALFIAEDFLFYWLHRLEHFSRFFWAVHITHHSSDYYNLTTGFRSSALQPLYRFLFFLPLSLVGFKAGDVAIMFSATQIYGILVHTRYIQRIPIWELLFVTPAHHRVHHAANVRYLDKNMGMALIIWDKLFGTFQDELSDHDPVRYGLHKKANNTGAIRLIFHEYIIIFQDFFIHKKHLPLSIRLKYMFKAPGWSHDGSSQTAEQLQKEGNF